MSIQKIKSNGYLEFLSGKKCPITGSFSVEIHHESLFREYSGSMKRYNDFQAIPLKKELHLYSRHSSGKEAFWKKFSINPYEISINFISEYIKTAPDDINLAIFYREKLIEQKDRWEFPSKQKYKSF
jgi:hypothetical protein